MIVVTHNGTDITDHIAPRGFRISDELNSTRDTFRFLIEKQPGGFAPSLNADVIVTLDGTRIFGGTITSVETSIDAVPTINYEVECIDYAFQLDRRLVTERYVSTTIEEIIADIIGTYTSGYTFAGVMAPAEVARISFNRLTVSQCLDKLAKLNNYSWYVDWYKDVHFFPKNNEPAPFQINDTNDSYILESLRIRSDLSQLRNIVQVIGAEQQTTPRTTKIAGNGAQTEFATNFKFAEKPTVTVNGVAKTVGVENLDVTGFDCYWSYQQKYVRFDPSAIPPAPTLPAVTNIEFTGSPLVPLVAIVPDDVSISEFGEFEHVIVERNLSTQDQTIERGIAQLESYAAALNEATFDTYVPGLRSGQIITVDSNLHGVTADYVIQSVKFAPYPNGAEKAGIWSVSLASTATMTLIDALRSVLTREELEDDEMEVLLAFYRFTDSGIGSDTIGTTDYTERPYYLADGAGVVTAGEPFICNYAVLEA